MATTKLWGGRFTGKTDPLMTTYNESIHYDKRMYHVDILGSQAYAKALHLRSILTQHERDEIIRGLSLVGKEWSSGTFTIVPGVDEDIHTANERRLGEIIGKEIAGKLHTGRSRNDQVATDMRMWLRDTIKEIEASLEDLLKAHAGRAEVEIDEIMPGYTHLQRAQPIRWAHWLMSHALSFTADLERLRELYKRVNKCPLGSGALAGNAFEVDREFLARELGFEGVVGNSMNGVADRDFVVEIMQWGALTMGHISRWAEDLIIYSTAEFGFVTLADAYSTGSSLMPQKKNPDSLELLRGKSGRVFGQMAGFMYTLKGLPTTYNKDLQEDKEPLFDCCRTLLDSIQIATGVLSTLKIHPNKMRAALTMDMLATDLADYLVRKGIPFRETHHISGAAVRLAEEFGLEGIDKLTLEQYKGLSPEFEEDVKEVFDFEKSVERRAAVGGTARKCVQRQVEEVKAALRNHDVQLSSKSRKAHPKLKIPTQELVIEGLIKPDDKYVKQGGTLAKISGTSNVSFAERFGLTSIGTVAHEWFMGIAAITGDYKHANKIGLREWVATIGKGMLGIVVNDTSETEQFLQSFSMVYEPPPPLPSYNRT
ncbi:argininosuccinate lyase [Rhizina undulata]